MQENSLRFYAIYAIIEKTVGSEPVMDFCDRVKQVRKKLNLSQTAFAQELGVSYTTINRWENGKFEPNYRAIKRFDEYCKEKELFLEVYMKPIWTDNKDDKRELRGMCPPPVGYRDAACPKCKSKNLTGAIITETADEQDPNILCKDCGYWFD